MRVGVSLHVSARSAADPALCAQSLRRYALSFLPLPSFMPWLVKYFLASSPERALRSAKAALPLIRRSLIEHEALIAEAGVPELLRKTGWIKLFRSDATLAKGADGTGMRRQYRHRRRRARRAGIAAHEPNLTGDFAGAIHWPSPVSFPIPAAWPKPMPSCSSAMAAVSSPPTRERSNNPAPDGVSRPSKATIRPRSRSSRWGRGRTDLQAARLYDPSRVKRGYHLHLAPQGNAVLHHPVLDADRGFLLAPMNRGIRLTTGAEFARRDAPPTPGRSSGAAAGARSVSAGRAGRRQAMDGRAALPAGYAAGDRPAPRHPGLWFDFGHQHHGLTLGPVTGRLLAEMITGETPFADPGLLRPSVLADIAGDDGIGPRCGSLASPGSSWRYCGKHRVIRSAHEDHRRSRLHAAKAGRFSGFRTYSRCRPP